MYLMVIHLHQFDQGDSNEYKNDNIQYTRIIVYLKIHNNDY